MKRVLFFLFFLLCLPMGTYAQETAIKYKDKVRLEKPYTVVAGQSGHPGYTVRITPDVSGDIYTVRIEGSGAEITGNDDFAGLFFRSVPGFRQGVCLQRYEPFNSWTKPVRFERMTSFPEREVQAVYWQYDDGVYAVAAPLNGNGFRTTFGANNGHFGSKAGTCPPGYPIGDYPSMVIGFGEDIYALFTRVYAEALNRMGCGENLVGKKSLPEVFDYLGWCSWNALGGGKKHSAEALILSIKSFREGGVPLGYAIIDDGWHSIDGRTLVDIYPNQNRYPDGFRDFVTRLKAETGIRAVGVWHALDAYWNGIASSGPLWDKYAGDLFSWKQRYTPRTRDTTMHTCYYFRPGSEALPEFWERWYSFLAHSGIGIVKVDNQCCVERMARDNYPADSLAAAMHGVINKAAFKYLGGRVVNCMAMSTDAFYHYGSTPIVRCSEDYFPYSPDETYDLEHGNAAAHIMQGVYNNLYISQMAYTDMDMFQTYNPNGELHAVARVLNNGPVYVTDSQGKQRFDILQRMILGNGRLVRSSTPLYPCEESLFQVQDKKLFKAFSFAGNAGVIGTFNLADCEQVRGTVSAADAHGIAGDSFVLYEHFSGDVDYVRKNDRRPVELGRMDYKLYYVLPYDGFAVVGLADKYNAPATVLRVVRKPRQAIVSLPEGGRFVCVSDHKPVKMTVNGDACTFTYSDKGVITAEIKGLPACEVIINW